jgi:hypothetical protein
MSVTITTSVIRSSSRKSKRRNKTMEQAEAGTPVPTMKSTDYPDPEERKVFAGDDSLAQPPSEDPRPEPEASPDTDAEPEIILPEPVAVVPDPVGESEPEAEPMPIEITPTPEAYPSDEQVTRIINDNPDSLEIGTPGKGGAIKVYGNFAEPDAFKAKIAVAIGMRTFAKRLMDQEEMKGD